MSNEEKSRYFDKSMILAVILITLLIIFAVLLARNVRNVYRSGALRQHRSVTMLLRRNKQANKISAADANYITSWMTFHYVNFIFNLPNDYLKNTLNINNSRYPDLTLTQYAKENKLDSNIFTENVKAAVRSFLNSRSSQ